MYIVPFHMNINFNEEERNKLSAQRIIQKNLVHFQGFPDRLYKKELLCSKEYFGQYGNITKIILTNKSEKKNYKHSNSAYISFETSEQASYAILAVDSIIIDNMLVRAFFGTTKYCNHFLNNSPCFNSDKCMFLHYIANENDIIGEQYKFGYSEHIKLAKQIIEFGSVKSRMYIVNNSNNNNTVLPSIMTIYHKKEIMNKTKNHRRKISDSSNNSSNNTNNNFETRSSSNDSNGNSNSNKNRIKSIQEQNNNIIYNSNNSNINIGPKNNSRFNFIKSNNSIDLISSNNNNKQIQDLLNDLIERLPFFIQFNKIFPLKILEFDYCTKLYIKTKNEEIKKLINMEF